MANTENEIKSVTGLDKASNRKEAEYDLLTALLDAADYKNTEITEVEMRRGGKYLFTVHLHPLNEEDSAFARKKATTYMPNPNNRKMPPIEKEFSSSKFNSWLIYLATVEADQEKIWGNAAFMQKHGLTLPVESIDKLLTYGEKQDLVETVSKISGLFDDEFDSSNEEDEDKVSEEEYVKN